MYSYIKWERSSVSGVKGCRFKINLEMPKLSFSSSAPMRPHAWYYIYGEPHTFRCCPLNPQQHKTRPLAAMPPPGRGIIHLQNLRFHLEILTYLGINFHFDFPQEFLNFHLNKNQTKRKRKRAEKVSVQTLHPQPVAGDKAHHTW